MKRYLSATLIALLAAAPLGAQAPKGWKLRADRSTTAADPDAPGQIKLATMGSGLHMTNPQAAVFWNPTNTASGTYTVKATFTLVRPSPHTNFYGLVFGGSALEGPEQSYLYFMVAQDGTWLLKRRDGNMSTQDLARAPSGALKPLDATGKFTNGLEVRVLADKIDYVVNGTVVHSTPKTGMTAKTDGIYGIRINHQLEVHVDGFGTSRG